jgi:hypothetical protein
VSLRNPETIFFMLELIAPINIPGVTGATNWPESKTASAWFLDVVAYAVSRYLGSGLILMIINSFVFETSLLPPL